MLTAAELRARCSEMERLHKAAEVSGLEADVSRHLTGRAQKIATSMPIASYLERRRELANLAAGAGHEVAAAYRAASLKLRDENIYPAGLESAVDDALLGRPGTDDATEIVRFHRGG